MHFFLELYTFLFHFNFDLIIGSWMSGDLPFFYLCDMILLPLYLAFG
jgi:hypothetical protein